MDDSAARSTYAMGKTLLARLGARKHDRNELGWYCEDLEDALLDLKLAVIDEDNPLRDEYIGESNLLIEQIFDLLRRDD